MSKGTVSLLPLDQTFFPAQRVFNKSTALSVSVNAQLLGGMQVGVGQALAGITDRLGVEVSRQLNGISQAFKQSTADPARRTEMFRKLGQDAQRSVSSSYGQFVTRQEGPASRTHYRQGEGRLANGVMRRALNNAQFFTASPDGLVFGNTAMLDREAKHWHRLAFGAGDRGEGSFEVYDVTLEGLTIAALGFNETESPAFYMPYGLFTDPTTGGVINAGKVARGGSQFKPSRPAPGRPKWFKTKGIQGKPFLEAGLRRLARDLPVALEVYGEQLADEALAGIGEGHRLVTTGKAQIYGGSLSGAFHPTLG